MKLTLFVAEGFKATTEDGKPIESGKAYEMTPRLDEYVRMGVLIPEGDEDPEESEGDDDLDPETTEEFRSLYEGMKVAELKEVIAEAGFDLPEDQKKASLVEFILEHQFGGDDQ